MVENNINLEELGTDDVLSPQEHTIVLGNLTDELLKENIFEQIDIPVLDLYDPTNFIRVFESRYSFLKTRFKDAPDFLADLEAARSHFYESVFVKICSKFGFEFDLEEVRLPQVTRALYEFFVLQYKEKIETFLLEYIIENKKSLAAGFDDGSKNLDLVSLKKVFKNKTDAVILSNIYKVVDTILAQDMEAYQILSIIVREDPSETTNYLISEYFVDKQAVDVDPDFRNRFFDTIVRRGEGYTRIMNELQMKLFGMFPKKTGENDEE